MDERLMLPLVILFAPLAGALILWAFGPRIGGRAGIVAGVAVFISFLGTLAAAAGGAATTAAGEHVRLVEWISGMTLGLLIDPLSLLWTLIITGVGFLITVYSIGYMEGDPAVARFFAYMNFFVFAMLTLALSDNFVGLLIGWGLVGLASYLLIGFWIERPSAVAAARKAFILNVVGDVGLLFAIFVIYNRIGAIDYATVFSAANVARFSPQELFLVCATLFVAVAAKSAQIPLHTWLPDAMEGPTPVSALIHAATMVTAGVYLIARCAPLYDHSPSGQELAAWIGCITLLVGAILGCVQWDIKRILAYSTMSQIGYMIMGVGVGAYSAGVMHFYTHACFKALLFLTAGVVIHELGGEQDVRRMGGLYRRIPFAFWCTLIGVIAITGILPVGGFFSKDAVLENTLGTGHIWQYAVGVFAAGLTAFYMFRLLFITFFGEDRSEINPELLGIEDAAPHAAHHPSKIPAWVMRGPVALLAFMTLVCGLVAIPWNGHQSPWTSFLGPLFPPEPHGEHSPFGEQAAILITLGAAAAGMLAAYWRYGAPNASVRSVNGLAAEARAIPAFLKHKFYFDELIDALFVTPAVAFGLAIQEMIEPLVIDGLVRDVVWFFGALGAEVRALQNGLVRGYAFLMVSGVVVALAYFAWLGVPR